MLLDYKNLQVIILAGGFGSRLSEYTKFLPKPLVKINKIPILIHIMNHYKNYGFKNFIIATGYKSNEIKKYFKQKKHDFNVKIVFTGKNSMTGGRILRLKKYINNTFFLTYGDGVSNVNLKKLYNFHIKNKKIGTVTAVRPPSRFGVLNIKKNIVENFKEKIPMPVGWINGGFFIFEPAFLKYIKNDQTILEAHPLETISKKKQLAAFKHHGFWKCVDTKRDKDHLDEIFKKKKAI
tara:strand:- start:142 stop:849 length:708 start_codon:yes stop_codon:yes gene_type:complete